MVEVDITHTGIDKLRLYGAMGVPEFWRYNGESWRIYRTGKNIKKPRSVQPFFSYTR
jgi:Uma2 family endonuclease